MHAATMHAPPSLYIISNLRRMYYYEAIHEWRVEGRTYVRILEYCVYVKSEQVVFIIL